MTDSGGDGRDGGARDGVRTARTGRRRVGIHRPGEVLFPGGGGAREHTGGDLVAHHRAVAPFLLPHLRTGPRAGLSRRGRARGPARRRLSAPGGGNRTPTRRPAGGRAPKEAS
ncbi:hypothetical protein APS67_001069 [Streptomyces sp. AVP053U2]|nr:hypothetical protein APS67_001069 [Streptomyces sp. AVP053U2]